MSEHDRLVTLESRVDSLVREVSRHDSLLQQVLEGLKEHDRWEREYRGQQSEVLAHISSDLKTLAEKLTLHLTESAPVLEAAKNARVLFALACWFRRNAIAIIITGAVVFSFYDSQRFKEALRVFGVHWE